MPMRLEFRKNGVIVWHKGVITDQDLQDITPQIYTHNYEEGLQFQLAEMSSVTEFAVSNKTMQMVGHHDRENLDGMAQHLVVVAPTDLLFGMARVWQSSAWDEQNIYHIVRSLSEAIAWLDEHGIKLVI